MNNRTRAVYWDGQELNISSVPLAQPTTPQGFILRVESAMFGTALGRAVVHGHPKWAANQVLGSLVAGEVVVAPRDESRALGDRLVVDPHPACMDCETCISNPALCANSGKLNPGGLSEYVAVDGLLADGARQVPDDIHFDEAVLTEIVACVMGALDVASIDKGSKVLIVGSGVAALIFSALIYRMHGLSPKIVVRNDFKANMALISNGEPVLAGALSSDTTTHSDIVIEATGTKDGYSLGLSQVAPGGQLIAFGGIPSGDHLGIDINAIHYGNQSIIGTYHYPPGNFDRAIKTIASRELDLSPLITNFISLEEALDAPRLIRNSDTIVCIVRPHEPSNTNDIKDGDFK